MSDGLTIRSRMRDYRVRFVDDFAAGLAREPRGTVFVVDERVRDLYGERLADALSTDHRVLAVEAGESSKTLQFCEALISDLIKAEFRRGQTLVAVGGGVIQDVIAFVATILYRGVSWKFYPTTLLAQADSCVGSKSSLNLGPYKNLLGTFCPPEEIVIDVGFLESLPIEAIRSGIGEILHFYLVNGHDGAARLMEEYDALLRNRRLLADHIRASLMIKKAVVEVDEFDRDIRNLFNYGHTFGHAIESVSCYSVQHGLAVTMGMDIANYVSLEYGLLDRATFEALRRLLARNMPEFSLDPERLPAYVQALARDKKNVGSDLTCILSAGPGKMQKTRIAPDERFTRTLAEYFRSLPVATVPGP